jgi:hypothetical protein
MNSEYPKYPAKNQYLQPIVSIIREDLNSGFAVNGDSRPFVLPFLKRAYFYASLRPFPSQGAI